MEMIIDHHNLELEIELLGTSNSNSEQNNQEKTITIADFTLIFHDVVFETKVHYFVEMIQKVNCKSVSFLWESKPPLKKIPFKRLEKEYGKMFDEILSKAFYMINKGKTLQDKKITVKDLCITKISCKC